MQDLNVNTGRVALLSWAFYDWANSAFAALIQTFVFATYFTRSVAENASLGGAQWGYMLGCSGLIVALGGPWLGAIADQSGRRKLWIAGFSGLCIAATASLWWIPPTPAAALPALLLVGLGTLGAEFAVIFYNAMLPALVAPERLGRWSGWAWGLGYIGGILCLVVALVVFINPVWNILPLDTTMAEPVRATFPLAALWYLVFMTPLLLFTPDIGGGGKRLMESARLGLGQLLDSLRTVRRYRHIVRFLIARLLFIDGLATLFAFGGVYAAGTFGLDAQGVLMFGIALNATAGVGAFAFGWVDDWLGAKTTILLALAGLLVTGTALLLVERVTYFWGFGLALGLFVGPAQAASRSYLARVAPAALRTELFGLFALSGKATAFVGPLLVGWLTLWADSQRVGMSVILALLALGMAVMFTVPRGETPAG